MAYTAVIPFGDTMTGPPGRGVPAHHTQSRKRPRSEVLVDAIKVYLPSLRRRAQSWNGPIGRTGSSGDSGSPLLSASPREDAGCLPRGHHPPMVRRRSSRLLAFLDGTRRARVNEERDGEIPMEFLGAVGLEGQGRKR